MSIEGKPELLVTAKNLDELKKLVDSGADAVNIGGEEYGLRVAGNFSLDLIRQGIKIAHENQARVYVSMNALLHNEDLNGLSQYIQKLAEYQADAIIFGDPAVLVTAKETAPHIPLHWNTETTSTNFDTVNYWASKGIVRAILARELSLEEVIEIKRNTDVQVQAQIHGMTCIFHSKRKLVTGYLDHIGQEGTDWNAAIKEGLFLREHKRPGEEYPLFEDRHGTHVMSHYDLCMIEHLNQFIDAGIDSLKVDGILHSTEYIIQVTKLYRQAIDDAYNHQRTDQLLDKIKEIQPKNRPLDTGFYFKKLFY